MATIKVSKQHIKNMESYINKINKKYDKKVSKKSIIDRVINNYHYIIEENMIEKIEDETALVAVDDRYMKMLKEDKERLHQPMYLILNACLDQYFSYGKTVKKNIALCQFKYTKKSYAFYFDEDELDIKPGNVIKVKSTNYPYSTKDAIKTVKVMDLAYAEDAKEKYKSVIKILR